LARKQSFSLICTIVPYSVPSVLSHPFYMMVLRGIAHTCQKQGYAITIYFTDSSNPDVTAVFQDYNRVLEIPADGIILTTTRSNDHFIPRLQADHVPFVHIGRLLNISEQISPYVDTDNYAGAQLATEHLLARGHRHIATITGELEMASGADRLRGFQDALHKAGCSLPPEWIIHGLFDPISGYQGMKTLLAGVQRPTAIFAASDSSAMGAMQAIQEEGLIIPQDIAIVGFDDIPEAANTVPTLTTIRQSAATLGEKAAEILLGIIENKEQETAIVLQPELVIRQST
jgi:LacI family transcriptional regulator